MLQIDLDAPIEPFVGMGGIRLYSTREALRALLESPNLTVKRTFNVEFIRYEIQGHLCLFFHKKNNKLWKITTLPEYRGKLFEKIGTDTDVCDLLTLEPSFELNDWEEVFESPKGALVEEDWRTGKCIWISVFIRELLEDEDRFYAGDW